MASGTDTPTVIHESLIASTSVIARILACPSCWNLFAMIIKGFCQIGHLQQQWPLSLCLKIALFLPLSKCTTNCPKAARFRSQLVEGNKVRGNMLSIVPALASSCRVSFSSSASVPADSMESLAFYKCLGSSWISCVQIFLTDQNTALTETTDTIKTFHRLGYESG